VILTFIDFGWHYSFVQHLLQTVLSVCPRLICQVPSSHCFKLFFLTDRCWSTAHGVLVSRMFWHIHSYSTNHSIPDGNFYWIMSYVPDCQYQLQFI